nr:histidine kinase dimerization/phospho-acceptor domain-containing protein [Paenibacillus lutrae]
MLRSSGKLSAVGQLAAGVAQEIRKLLTAIKRFMFIRFMQFLQAGAEAEESYYEIIRSELNRIDLIISELLKLARSQTSVFKWLDPSL